MQDGTFPLLGYLRETDAGRGNVFASDCPTRQLLDRIGDKWSVLVLLLLGEEDKRFNELKRQIGGISQKMLSQTLRSLERDGLVTREAEPTVPVTVTYGIAPLGRELLAALQFIIEWAETRMVTVTAAQQSYDRRHLPDRRSTKQL
jgi:DNA-binding HxlR family transcriptional regulator